MAIGTNDAVEKFGTRQALETSGSLVSSGAFVQATTSLVATDDVVYGNLDFSGTFASNPTAGSTADVYLRAMGINATDASTPSNNFQHIYAGSIPLNGGGVTTVATIDIGLPNHQSGQVYEVYIKSNAGINLDIGWTLGFTPKAIGPKA